MASKIKKRTVRQRRRRNLEATYEEPDTPNAPTPADRKVKQPFSWINEERRCSCQRRSGETSGQVCSNFYNLGVEGVRKQFKEILAPYRAPDDKYKFTAFEAHPDKNRYLDVVCLDHSRVHLTLNVPPCTDYIHANWVRFEGHDKVFIATQAPLENTIEDFWRMVFQEGCPHIVNLTKLIEDGKVKSTQYWPLEAGQYQTFGKMFVNTKKVESEGKFMIYTVEVLPEGCSNSNIVKVLHMTSWPDRGLPMSGRHVLRLIRQVSGDKLDNGPIVMHCSAGIGRTGTIIMIDIILRRLFSCKEVDMVEVFKTLRNQRASCIQLEGQYVFVILSVLDYIKIKCPKYKERVNKYIEDFRTTIFVAQ